MQERGGRRWRGEDWARGSFKPLDHPKHHYNAPWRPQDSSSAHDKALGLAPESLVGGVALISAAASAHDTLLITTLAQQGRCNCPHQAYTDTDRGMDGHTEERQHDLIASISSCSCSRLCKKYGDVIPSTSPRSPPSGNAPRSLPIPPRRALPGEGRTMSCRWGRNRQSLCTSVVYAPELSKGRVHRRGNRRAYHFSPPEWAERGVKFCNQLVVRFQRH